MPSSEDCARPAFCFISVVDGTYFMSSVYPLFIDLILFVLPMQNPEVPFL